MNKQAIVDIGSNTIVLLIYKIEENKRPEVIFHDSKAVHLVSYNKNGHMEEEGIQNTVNVLKEYRKILNEQGIQDAFGFVTEPWRHIDNATEMLAAFAQCGFNIKALTGEEEASFDFIGSRLDTKDIQTGFAFDVGGGSSELVSFSYGRIVEATSIPLGCVRLKQLPLDSNAPKEGVLKAFEEYPNLIKTWTDTIVGIGGTVRACGILMNDLYQTGDVIDVNQLHHVFDLLVSNDEEMVQAMHRNVSENRWDVFLPGLNMVLTIADLTHAKTIRVSEGCVREGFLFHVLDLVKHA